jgi:hypothetical protein
MELNREPVDILSSYPLMQTSQGAISCTRYHKLIMVLQSKSLCSSSRSQEMLQVDVVDPFSISTQSKS